MRRLLLALLVVQASLAAPALPQSLDAASASHAAEPIPVPAEAPPSGSRAAPYILVGLGVLLAIALVIGSADTSDYDREPGF